MSLSMVLGTPTIGHAALVELVRDGERAVAADDDERVETERVEVLDAARRVVGRPVGVVDGIREGIAAVGRAENRAAEAEDAGDVRAA